MSQALEDYALIGDGRTAALIGRDGSLDWLCWPRFDSAACFAKLLGDAEHGCWSIAPAHAARVKRRYLPDTLILETDFETASGAVRLLDFMPPLAPASSVIRLVVGLRGNVTVRSTLALRFDYGALMPWVEPRADGALARAGADLAVLYAPVAVSVDPRHIGAEFAVEEGRRLAFVLSYGPAEVSVPQRLDAERALADTAGYWQRWIGRFERPTPWPDAVRRSLLTLRALIHQPTGALIAAPTTSLPEQAGGSYNWDYRYCWLRDSTFTLTALLNAGYREEAAAWRDWILRSIAAEPSKMHVIYRVDGSRDVDERTLDWLPGYRWSAPVRVGNAAACQHQVDVYGEVIDAMELATRAGIPQSEHGMHVERGIVEHLEHVWNTAGQGLWESRGEARHYTYSRVMAWVGVDRFLRSAARHGHAEPALLERLGALRTRIHAEVCREGYDVRLEHFVQHYGGRGLDASLLLLPLVGFIGVEDPRMANTIAAIERELLHDGLVLRHPQRSDGRQGAFLACSCWLADCQRQQGRLEQARATLERVLALRNDVGLLSEEYSAPDRRLCGNFPQAFSHLAVVNAALAFSGPMLQRGGG
ncbi:MAG TPA: glycoside hydrolase family 15 protein [Steroidobacteraceae bacterium]|jgi:GH15 family glucan-1,4-alpha-glucosidase|nr:glycoside hydrolase family 15 protein [Steroidobacteraceae bacterium]